MTYAEPTWEVDGEEFTAPRDIGAYHPGDHFLQRLKYRTDPEPSGEIATETIREGHVKHSNEAHLVHFEHEVGRETWTVVAHIKRRAFVDPDVTHKLVTIYAHSHDGHQTVFDTGGVT